MNTLPHKCDRGQEGLCPLTPIIYTRILILLKIYIELGLNMHFFPNSF